MKIRTRNSLSNAYIKLKEQNIKNNNNNTKLSRPLKTTRTERYIIQYRCIF